MKENAMATATLNLGVFATNPPRKTGPPDAWGVRGSRSTVEGALDPDYSLVSRCLSGDETAWEQFVRVHTRHVYALCYRFTGSGAEAQDLTQEVFLRVFRTLKSFRSAEGSL